MTFRIPDNWGEEYENEGGGTFYKNCPDSGTLRLNVITLKVHANPTPDVIEQVLRSSRGSSHCEIRFMPSGNAVLHYGEKTIEKNERLTMYYWEVANPIPPGHFHLAIFSYTILEAKESDPRIQAELSMLDKEIRASVFLAGNGEN